MERNTDFACTGWTASVKPVYATKQGMINIRDMLLAVGYKEAAAALDNAIDLIEKAYKEDREQDALLEAITEEAQEIYFWGDFTQRVACVEYPQFERTQEEALELTKKTYGASVAVSSDWLRRHL